MKCYLCRKSLEDKKPIQVGKYFICKDCDTFVEAELKKHLAEFEKQKREETIKKETKEEACILA